MSITIKTNNQPRPLLYWHELTSSEQAEYDWIEPTEVDSYNFFRYKGYCYCTDNFINIDKNSLFYGKGWEGYSSDSFFSGGID